jgi:hypothetical protein
MEGVNRSAGRNYYWERDGHSCDLYRPNALAPHQAARAIRELSKEQGLYVADTGDIRGRYGMTDEEKKDIQDAVNALERLGPAGWADEPFLVLDPEKGDNAIIIATFTPHSGAECLMRYLHTHVQDILLRCLAESSPTKPPEPSGS